MCAATEQKTGLNISDDLGAEAATPLKPVTKPTHVGKMSQYSDTVTRIRHITTAIVVVHTRIFGILNERD